MSSGSTGRSLTGQSPRSRKLGQPLRILSTATSSNYQAGNRAPRRIRASGIDLRWLISSKSVAAAALSSTNRGRFRQPQPMLTAQAWTLVTDFESALGWMGSSAAISWIFLRPLIAPTATPALTWGLKVRRFLIGGSPVQGRYPASEVNDRACPAKPDHLSHLPLVIDKLLFLGSHQLRVILARRRRGPLR